MQRYTMINSTSQSNLPCLTVPALWTQCFQFLFLPLPRVFLCCGTKLSNKAESHPQKGYLFSLLGSWFPNPLAVVSPAPASKQAHLRVWFQGSNQIPFLCLVFCGFFGLCFALDFTLACVRSSCSEAFFWGCLLACLLRILMSILPEASIEGVFKPLEEY